MPKRIRTNIILILIITGVLAYGTIWYNRWLAYYGERVLVGSKTETVAVYVEPDDTATRAAAKYMANAIEQSLGVEPVIVTEKQGERKHICILVEENLSPDEKEQKKYNNESTTPESAQNNKADIVITAAADTVAPAAADLPSYSVVLEKENVVISVAERKDCFGVVKAFSDRWLQKDCGLETSKELRISTRMIKEQLSGLPIEYQGEIKILTQNLRYIDDADGNSVEERAQRFKKLVQKYQPDLIGTQECTLQWLQLLKDVFSEEYEMFGCSRLGPDSEEEEWNAVFYRRDRFSRQDGDTFWLSNTPGTVASKLNYEGCVRICTWVQLHDIETGKRFLFSNTHLQDGATEFFREVRVRQVETLFQQLRKGQNRLATIPGFLIGDFNGEANEPFYSQITDVYQDARITAIDNESAVDYSFHAYGNAKKLIDFCFCSPESVTVLAYKILDDQYGGYVSDHYGILVTALVNGR